MAVAAATLVAAALLGPLVMAWQSPQTASHPAFGWPTMNDPAQGLLLDELPAWWTPIPERPLPDTVTGLDFVTRSDGVTRGSGIATFGSLAFVPGWSHSASVVDISDPENPRVLSTIPGTPGRDADVIAYPDGRLVLVMASDYGVVPLWNVTDPENPTLIRELRPAGGSHNVGVVPGTPILYNANTDGDRNPFNAGRFAEDATGATEIYDLTDPEAPVERVWMNGYGCHDVTFFVDEAAEKYRAYCAGIEMTQIWDVADPWNPVVLTNLPVHHGVDDAPSAEVGAVIPLMFSHLATVNHDASILIVGDETGGGAYPPGCDASVDAAAATVSGPLGNFWFYDVTDEANPILRGWISPTIEPGLGTCTMHFGRLVEDRNLIVAGAYSAGTVLIDFDDPFHPVIVDQFNSGTTWDAWYYNGWVFTGDLSRGMDVLTFT